VRLDLVLIRRHPELSRRRAREVIEKGQVSLAGETLLEPGLDVPAEASPEWDPNRPARPRARASLPVLYEDDQLLAIDKPAGLLAVPTAPGRRDEDTALARLGEYMRRRRPRRPWVGVVHRIDRDTSGVLVFALDPQTRGALRSLFRRHAITRRYLALVSGSPATETGTIDAPIHDVYQSGRRRIARPHEPSHEALTRYRVVERFERAALVELELETGRQHQIRLHLAHVGLPILGDAVYAGPRASAAGARPGRQLLHARLLAFTHPSTGRALSIESGLPADFARVLEKLRREARKGAAGPPAVRRGRSPATARRGPPETR